MITIQNGKLTIPDNDRFIGFAGDNSANTKQLLLLNRVKNGCTYTLCLRFDDDSVCSVPLTAVTQGADTVLTWEVLGEQLYTTGIVTAQLKTVDSDGSIAHSTKDFFIVGSSVEFDDDGGDMDYVTSSQLKNSINQALQSVSSIAPYIGDDGYWYVYDAQAGSYNRTEYYVGAQKVDSALSDNSENPVGNRYIKQYVDSKADECRSYTDSATADKVDNTQTIAGLPLTANISSAELTNAIRSNLIRTNVLPNVTSGAQGTIGIGPNSEVYFCTADNRWEHLAKFKELNEKMGLIEEVGAEDISYVDNGNLFLSAGTLYMKYNGNVVALVTGNDVYTKAEIDSMIGNVETLLAQI